jgi:hypothetical protein
MQQPTLKISTWLLAGIILSTATVACATPLPTAPSALLTEPKTERHPFDVEKHHWSYSAVNFLASNGILSPAFQNHVKSQTLMSRYEFALVVASLIEPEGTDLLINGNNFVKTISQARGKALALGAPLSPEAQEKCVVILQALCREYHEELKIVGVTCRFGLCWALPAEYSTARHDANLAKANLSGRMLLGRVTLF